MVAPVVKKIEARNDDGICKCDMAVVMEDVEGLEKRTEHIENGIIIETKHVFKYMKNWR